MAALPNLHFPNLSVAKLLSSVLAIALFLFVAVAAVSYSFLERRPGSA